MALLRNWNAWLNRNAPGRTRRFSSVEHVGYLRLTLLALGICIYVPVWSAGELKLLFTH